MYPEFLPMCAHAPDAYWSNVFENLSQDVCPFGVCVTDTLIFCNLKNRKFKYNYKNKHPKEAMSEIRHLLSKHMGLQSMSDAIHANKMFNLLLDKEYTCWKDIRKKHVRKMLIEQYVIKIKQEFKLTSNQIRNFMSLLNLAFNFNTITKDNIVFNSERCAIDHINGIENIIDQILQDQAKDPLPRECDDLKETA